MKVTSLDVKNLFSFGEFHLDFDDGLTVLVGPNGAGKTNIVRVLDLVTKLVDWADERSRLQAAPPTPADAMLSSYVQAMHDGSAPGAPMEIRLGVQFTTTGERTRIVTFFRAALLAALSDGPHSGDADRRARLTAWVTEEVDKGALLPLFAGALVFRHPGYDGASWEARYEFEVDESPYDWVLFTPSYSVDIVARGAAVGPTTPEMNLSEALFGAASDYANPPSPLPDPLPRFALGALCPPAGKRVTNLVIRLGTGAVNDQHEPFRAAANLLGFRVFTPGGYQTFGLARALRLNLTESLVVLGEQFRGLGVGGIIPWRAGIYPWELLAGSGPPRDPGFLPLRLFRLKNGASTQERENFAAIQAQFERLAPGHAFDVTFAAARTPVATTAPTGAGQVEVPAGDGEGEDDGQPGSIITVISWHKTDDGTTRRERPIQLFGAGTWEALVLAEVLVSAPDRLTVLDEPGASLHPTWQTTLREDLRSVTGQVLLVTHSPHLVPMEAADDLRRLVRISNDGGSSHCHRLGESLDEEQDAESAQGERSERCGHGNQESDARQETKIKQESKITQEFGLSSDARALLFSRGAVIVSGPTEQGALPIWCTKSEAAKELGAPAARDIVFYSAPGDTGFRTILSVLHGFGIPWVVVCDGKSFDIETNWSHHIFRQIHEAGVNLPKLKQFIDTTGKRGNNQQYMTQESWDEQVTLGDKHGVFTLTTSWTGSAEAVESFIEVVAPGKLADAEAKVGNSKSRKGRWVAQQTDCPAKIDDLYRKIIAAFNLEPGAAPTSGPSPSQRDSTVTR